MNKTDEQNRRNLGKKQLNRGAGYGLELPCESKFQGDKFSGDLLEEKLKKENFDVL